MLPDSWLSRPAIGMVVCLLLLAGCKHREKKIQALTDEDGATLASVVAMGDPKTAPQLLKGFHTVEESSWRWTMGRFAVALRPPRNAAVRGAVLHFRFVLPEAVLSKVHKMSLSAAVNGTPLSPETYATSGEMDYTRPVDGKLLAGDAVNVEFTLDKFIPAGTIEDRELGVIATSVGFEAK
jgi:hypothetical protein